MPIFHAVFLLTTGICGPAENIKTQTAHGKVLLVSAAICMELTNIFSLCWFWCQSLEQQSRLFRQLDCLHKV